MWAPRVGAARGPQAVSGAAFGKRGWPGVTVDFLCPLDPDLGIEELPSPHQGHGGGRWAIAGDGWIVGKPSVAPFARITSQRCVLCSGTGASFSLSCPVPRLISGH